ncbi:MAG: DUF3472 domain-containing protein [Pirellulales bacterium]
MRLYSFPKLAISLAFLGQLFFASLPAATSAGAPESVVLSFVNACTNGDVPQIQRFLAPDAAVCGQPLDRVLSAVERRTRRYEIGTPVVGESSETAKLVFLPYQVRGLGTNGLTAFYLKRDIVGRWLITEVVRLDPSNLEPRRAALILRNPLRNFFIGLDQKQEVSIFPTAQPQPVGLSAWKAVLRTKTNSYPIAVTGPGQLSSGANGLLILHADESLASNADVSHQQTALLHLTCNVQGKAEPWELQIPVYTYNNREHRAVHANLINKQGIGLKPRDAFSLAEIRVRFRVLELSGTYYAAMRFKGGYAGFQYWPEREVKHAWWFSVWNNPDVGWERHNLFDTVNTQAGFQLKLQPPRSRGDQNYANITNKGMPWEPGRDYTFALTVDPHIDGSGEPWTRFSLKVLEHEGDRVRTEIPFGAILRYGKCDQPYCHAFMEALGKKSNYQRRQMEIVSVQYRKVGSTQMERADISKAGTSVLAPDDGADRYPRAAWMTGQGCLRMSSGGETPLRPGELLLDY